MKILTHISTTIKSTVILATATLLAVAFLLVTPGVRAATPAFVQVQAKKISSGNVNSQTFNTTAGNILVVYVLWENNQSVTVADGGNIYQPVAPATLFNSNQWSSQVFYANNLTGGSTTLSVTFDKPIGSWAMVYAHEYSGVDKSANPIDVFNTVVGSSGSMSNSIATTKANDLLFATGAANGCVTSSDTFTTRSTLSCDRTMDKVTGAAGTYSISPSHYGNPWVIHLIAFKADSGDIQAPSVPTGLSTAAASETQINLTWNTSSDNVGVTGYKIYRNDVQVGTATATSYSDGGLAPNTAYNYTVSAFDAAGNNSAQSASASGTTLADATAPSVPASLTATAISDTQVNLSWDASTDNIDVIGYKIFRDGAEVATTSGTSYSNTGLVASTTYSYTVSAFDAAGNSSAQSAPASATTQAEPDTAAPSVPTNLAATAASSTVVDLTWNAATDNVGVAGYNVYRDSVEIAASVAGTTYQDIGRTAGATYNYTVSAFDAAGNNSAQSAAATVTMPAPPDITPPVLSDGQPAGALASGTTTAILSLTTGENATCRYATVADTSYDAMPNTFTATGGTSHSDQLSGLADGQSYSYYVRCQDAANNANSADYTISFSVAALSTGFSYERVVVDSASANNPWMKGVGDFNGDGIADLMVSGENGPVVWYETPTWTERQISATASSQSGSAVGDIDGDGDTDVIVGVVWFENIDNGTSWVAHTLPGSDPDSTHDIAVADLNGDGKNDIAMRGEGSAVVQIFLQTDPTTWTSFTVDPGLGLNGLGLADVNNDGRLDVVVGGKWMENPGGAIATTPWPTRVVTNTWNGYAAVKVVDLNGDGRQDMVMSVSEEVGKLSWFEQLVDGTWQEHVIDTDLSSVHGVIVEDIDKDGLLDIVASEYRTPGDLTIYRNTGGASGWESSVLGSDSLHNLQVADLNGDCKPDFFGVHAFGVNPVVVYRSTGASACPPSGEPDTELPSVPTGLQASAVSYSQIDLSWTASTDNVGVTGYKVYREGALINGNVTGTTYQDTGLSAETTYSYTVSAFDASGNNSAQSVSSSATTLAPQPPDTTAPSVPTGLNASAVSTSQVNLSWTASTDNSGVKNYYVFASTDNITFALVGSPTTTSFSHTGLTASTTYYYKVQAEDNAGNVSGDSAVASAITQTPPPVSEFLMAAWGFNEGSGTTASDASQNGNAASITGNSPWGMGKYGTGLSFSGTTHLSVPNSATTNISGSELTLSLWVNPQQGSTTDSILLGKFWHPSTWTDPYYQFGFELWGGNEPVFQVGTSSGVKNALMGSTIPLNQWTHLAVTFNGSQAKFYVNGNLVSTKTLNATITVRGNGMFIGADQSVGQHVKGTMDDVRIYNKALTQAEIQADMAASL